MTHEMTDAMADNPCLYVGTYEKYNNGSLDGAWVDLTQFKDKDEFYDFIEKLHKDEHDPEFMFQDFQNFPEFLYSECELDERIFDWLALPDEQREYIAAYWDEIGQDDIDYIEEAFYGCYKDFNEFVYDSVDNCFSHIFKDHPTMETYFDYEAYGRDLTYDYNTADAKSGVFIYRKH